MRRRVVTIATGIIAAGLVASGGVAFATGAGDDDTPVSGASRERAVTAALRHTGGGTVTETEIGDDGAAYGVEVRLADGTQVEVSLDERFNVIGVERDDDRSNEAEERDD